MSHQQASSTGMKGDTLSLQFLMSLALQSNLSQDKIEFLKEVYYVLGYISARKLLEIMKTREKEGGDPESQRG